MKKILFATKNMNVGGVEKSLISLLSTIDYTKYEVHLLLLEESGDFMLSIPKNVKVIISKDYLNIANDVNLPPLVAIKKHLLQRKFKRSILLSIGYLLSKIKKNYKFYYKAVFKNVKKLNEYYDIAISYTSVINYLTWFVLNHVEADKYIGWIHFDVSKLNLENNLLIDLHKKMNCIYIVSQAALSAFIIKFPKLQDKCELRYNVIDKNMILRKSKEKCIPIKKENLKVIVTLGRLTNEKGQNIIPEVALILKNNKISFQWYIIGEGYLEKQILEKSKSLGLQNFVILLGKQLNPYPYLRQADLYVQTSIYEGFCLTLAEAKIFGMPIISTKFAGAEEQLENYDKSLIVNRNVNEIVKGIKDFI